MKYIQRSFWRGSLSLQSSPRQSLENENVSGAAKEPAYHVGGLPELTLSQVKPDLSVQRVDRKAMGSIGRRNGDHEIPRLLQIRTRVRRQPGKLLPDITGRLLPDSIRLPAAADRSAGFG